MSCSVSIGGGDYDGSPEFENVREVKARKAHKCVECRSVIAAGETYERVAGKFEGRFYCNATCNACSEIRNAFENQDGAYSTVGELWQEMREQFSDVTTACFDQLTTVEGKRKLRDEWMKWKGLAA
jgi:hypothetical protein